MAYAKILVPVTGAANDSIALATAFAVGKPFDAHVEALFVHPDPGEVVPYVYSGATVSPLLIQSIIEAQRKLVAESLAAARSHLAAAAKDAGALLVPHATRTDGLTGSLQIRHGFVPRLVSEAARLCDLVVLKPLAGDERVDLERALLETLTHANRPVLLPPKAPVSTFAQKIAIAWDGGDAAAHAVTASLPLLENAVSVDILTVDRGKGHGTALANALRDFLALHKIAATPRVFSNGRGNIASTIVESAGLCGADLLVMGGYGHSHLREALLGGVTLEIVSTHTLPVFLMH